VGVDHVIGHGPRAAMNDEYGISRHTSSESQVPSTERQRPDSLALLPSAILGIPPPPRSIGMFELGGNCEKVYGAQYFTGKILKKRELCFACCSDVFLTFP
jgi:hypothetical protein